VGRILGGSGLVLLALFMLVGFLRADLTASGFASTVAFLIAVVLPGAGGLALIASHMGSRRRLAGRHDQLRRQTLDSEVMRLAARRGGRLTVVEVITELAVSTEAAKESLDALAMQEVADMEVTDSGMLVYAFRDIQNLSQKENAKGILDD
jgi:hypothetical protein